ncbi:alpha/beta fold hydrolase [Pararhodobacter zhoushanensis]|uniref:Alpha/beta hydrolase n=1 Tax=Pararhodobacter zhoushanensis TaxID=2479545 RepID=A0ABT3H0Q3_9RHOB|nr:alpha/beta hydrolase [Pararhodobacter zhoushanensis]MCW1933362.1 alpha/beta hydrolase [Pararhodobacter zhoushanensis]
MPFPASVTTVTTLVAVIALAGCAALVDNRADRRESEWMQEFPPLGQFVEVEGHRIHILVTGRARGTAPDLVLIHGANGNLRDFTFDLVALLEDDYRIIAVDRPGLGWSDSWGDADSDPRLQARVLHEAVEQIGVRRPLVLGHSYGGAVALAWALQNQRDTAGLVLVAAASEPWEGGLSFWYGLNETPLGTPARAIVTAFATESAINAALDKVFEPDSVPAGYSEEFGVGLSLRRESQENNNRQVNALRDYIVQMQPDYPSLTLPIEMLHGDADTIVGLDIHSRRFVGEVASANLTVIPGAGHMLHHTHPQAVIDAINRVRRRSGR